MLTPAIFERQMLEYEEISNEIMESEEKDPERARKRAKELSEKIQKDMFFVLEQQGYTAGVRVLRRIYYGDDGAGQN